MYRLLGDKMNKERKFYRNIAEPWSFAEADVTTKKENLNTNEKKLINKKEVNIK